MSRIDDEADLTDIVGLCELMVMMLSQPDADSVLGGLHTAASITLDKARAVLDRRDTAGQRYA
jgi:hypothetical protein